jgi:hypothetical protein
MHTQLNCIMRGRGRAYRGDHQVITFPVQIGGTTLLAFRGELSLSDGESVDLVVNLNLNSPVVVSSLPGRPSTSSFLPAELATTFINSSIWRIQSASASSIVRSVLPRQLALRYKEKLLPCLSLVVECYESELPDQVFVLVITKWESNTCTFVGPGV